MKKNIFLVVFTIFALSVNAQTNEDVYNKHLADSLGADNFGMKKYVLVILKTGTNNITDKIVRDSLFKGHLANIDSLAKIGKLTVAGPIIKSNEKKYRGIFVLNVTSIVEAEGLLNTDPTIKEKVLEAELYEWYCSAALPMFLPYHNKIEKKKIF